ncbi:O-antigen ligase family protein [bacterium]|nr:O-antigen ligase family protein [bacterium]
MKSYYTLLFALSIILINPWGNSRGEIWTHPKVLIVLIVLLLNLALLTARPRTPLPRRWLTGAVLWLLFLGCGWISTCLSPFPSFSLLGQEQMGDGWLYWLLIAGFTLTNSLLLYRYPELLRPQLNGLLIGSAILALSIFPQVINWQIDYTATMGQLLRDNILVSTIYQAHQPIGLYSNRGHAAFVLAAAIALTLVTQQRHWLTNRQAIPLLILLSTALLLTQNRAGILAAAVGCVYLLGRQRAKWWLTVALLALIIISFHTVNSRLTADWSWWRQLSSDRTYAWQLAVRGIQQRPFWGWGFGGFGIAYPYVLSPTWTPQVEHLGNFSFVHRRETGELARLTIYSFKAHNLFLDTAVSLGLVGLLVSWGLWSWYGWRLYRSARVYFAGIAIVYLVFTLTWFECAQYSHLAWWVLSLSEWDSGTSDQLLAADSRG